MGFHGARSAFYSFQGTKSVFHGYRWVFMVIQGARVVFQGSRSIFMIFIVLGQFLWFSRFQVGFSWFQEGFYGYSRL